MTKYYHTEEGVTSIVDGPVKDCWVCMTNPTDEEIDYIADYYGIEDVDDLRAALDVEESSRIDVEDNYVLILVDVPTTEVRNDKNRYVTIPLGIIMLKDAVITVCLEESDVLDFFQNKKASRIFSTHMKTRFLLQILYHTAKLYLSYLKVINRQSEELEKKLHDSTSNPTLIDLMELGKSLLYFSTSLKSLNTSVLDKIPTTKAIKKYEDDEELLEDVIIECKQALEMSEIYSGLLNGMMDAYASVIGNNMNVVQKFLAVATIILSIPNIVSGYYGMNLATEAIPLARNPYSFWIIIALSVVMSVITWLYFRNKKLY